MNEEYDIISSPAQKAVEKKREKIQEAVEKKREEISVLARQEEKEFLEGLLVLTLRLRAGTPGMALWNFYVNFVEFHAQFLSQTPEGLAIQAFIKEPFQEKNAAEKTRYLNILRHSTEALVEKRLLFLSSFATPLENQSGSLVEVKYTAPFIEIFADLRNQLRGVNEITRNNRLLNFTTQLKASMESEPEYVMRSASEKEKEPLEKRTRIRRQKKALSFLNAVPSVYDPRVMLDYLQEVFQNRPKKAEEKFVTRFLKTRQEFFSLALETFQELQGLGFGVEVASSFQKFCTKTFQIQGWADLLSNGLYIDCYMDVFHLDSKKTLQNIPFAGVLTGELFGKTFTILELVDLVVEHFRRSFRNYSYLAQELEYLKFQVTPESKLEAAEIYQQFFSTSGIFWLHFEEIDRKAMPVRLQEFAKSRLRGEQWHRSKFGSQAAGSQETSSFLVPRIRGFVFCPTAQQAQTFLERASVVFSHPGQFSATSLHEELEKKAPVNIQGCSTWEEFFQRVSSEQTEWTKVFCQTTENFVYMLLQEQQKPLFLKLRHSPCAYDLQESLPLNRRLFSLQPQTKTTFFAEEARFSLLIAFYLFSKNELPQTEQSARFQDYLKAKMAGLNNKQSLQNELKNI